MAEIKIYELREKGEISVRLWNSVARNCSRVYRMHPEKGPLDITFADIVKLYSRTEIFKFKNMGKATIGEFDVLAEKFGYILENDRFVLPAVKQDGKNKELENLIDISMIIITDMMLSLSNYRASLNDASLFAIAREQWAKDVLTKVPETCAGLERLKEGIKNDND